MAEADRVTELEAILRDVRRELVSLGKPSTTDTATLRKSLATLTAKIDGALKRSVTAAPAPRTCTQCQQPIHGGHCGCV